MSNQSKSSTGLSIGAKIAGALLVLVLLVLAVSVVGYTGAQKQADRFDGVRLANERATTVQEVERAVIALQRDVEHYTFTGHESIAEAVRARSATVRAELGRVEQLSQSATETELVRRLKTHLTEYERTFEQAVEERALRRELVGVSTREAQAFALALRPSRDLNAAQLAAQEQLRMAMHEAETSLYRYLHRPRFSLLTNSQTKLERARADFDEQFPGLQGSDSPGGHAARYLSAFTRIVQATRGYLHLTGVVMAGEALEFGYVTKQLRDTILGQVNPMSEEFAASVVNARQRMVLVSIGALVLALLVASTLTKSLSGPIGAIASTLTKLANDEEATVPGTERRDEIGQMARAADVFKRKNAETKALLERARKLTVELEHHRRQLQKSNTELEQFVYTVSHDLKSPVVTTAGFLGMIRRMAEQGQVDKAIAKLDTLESANRRMAQLIDDLLDLSRVGRIDNDLAHLDPAKMLRAWKDDNQPRLDQADMQVSIGELPPVEANQSRLMQVFDNLLSNALKYGHPGSGGGQITVCGEETADEVRYCVRDTGPGIAPEFHEKVFGLFQRLSTDAPGTGVGLAIVYKIMNTHGGRVWVESAGDNDGARFWIAFPRRRLDGPGEVSQS